MQIAVNFEIPSYSIFQLLETFGIGKKVIQRIKNHLLPKTLCNIFLADAHHKCKNKLYSKNVLKISITNKFLTFFTVSDFIYYCLIPLHNYLFPFEYYNSISIVVINFVKGTNCAISYYISRYRQHLLNTPFEWYQYSEYPAGVSSRSLPVLRITS